MNNILITQKFFIDERKRLTWFLEKNWFKFFEKKQIKLVPLNPYSFKRKKLLSLNPKALILTGGNDLYDVIKLRGNLIRDKYERNILNFAIKNKIPILAICRGFQFVAKFFKCKIFKIINHVRTTHNLKVDDKIFKFKIEKFNVNSYHNYAIYELPKHFNFIIRHSDNSIELAKTSKYKILCLMFHPERQNTSQRIINKIIFSHLKI